MDWLNIPNGVNTCGVYRYTIKGGTIIKHKLNLYLSNFVTKPISNNKEVFYAKICIVNSDCNGDFHQMITPFVGVTAKEMSADDMICCENDNFLIKWYIPLFLFWLNFRRYPRGRLVLY